MPLYQRSLLLLAEIPLFLGVSLLYGKTFAQPTPTPTPTASPAPRQPVPSPKTKPVAVEVQASGTEPFWGLTITNRDGRRSVHYTTPSTGPAMSNSIYFTYSPPLQAQGRPKDHTIVYPLKLNGVLRGNLILQKVYKGFCNDGMSDNRYPYSATLIVNNQVQTGCASTIDAPMIPGQS